MIHHHTIRQEIVEALKQQPLSTRDISGLVGIPEKEVYDHLKHIKKTLQQSGYTFLIVPAHCRECGFVFVKRDRLKKPSKCPVCRKTFIGEPLFSIVRV